MEEELQLLGRGVHPLAPDLQLVGIQVDDQSIKGETAGFGLVPAQAAKNRVDPGQQFFHFKGFDNIVVGPHLQAGHLVNGLALGGEHDDRGFVGLPNFGADRPAVHHRKHNVQEDQVRAKEAIELQCFAAISGDHGFIAFFF